MAQPIQSGVSKNGNNWQRQDFVLEIPGQYPKKVAFSVMNSNIQNFGLAVGQDVDIEIDINANEWQGKWFNSITCWKATLRNPGQPTAAQQPQTYYQGGIIHRGTRTNCHTSTASGFWGTKRRFAFLKKRRREHFGSLLIN